MVLVREDGNLLAYQMPMRYLSPRLRYNYFRFRKTDGLHFVFLFPVSIFFLIFVIGVSFCIGLPYFVKSNNPWRSYDVISILFKMAAGSHIGFDLDNIEPLTKCNSWSEVLKFGLDQIHSFGDIVIFIFFAVLA